MENNATATSLSMIEDMIIGRNNFLSDDMIRRLPFDSRASIINTYLTNERLYLTNITQLHTYNAQLQSTTLALLALGIPNSTSAFMSPVAIVPTRAQITRSLQDCPSTTSSCAICQDAISSGGCRIRQCGHVYHRDCIENWFSTSVRCPVCRHDIREEDQTTQTLPVS